MNIKKYLFGEDFIINILLFQIFGLFLCNLFRYISLAWVDQLFNKPFAKFFFLPTIILFLVIIIFQNQLLKFIKKRHISFRILLVLALAGFHLIPSLYFLKNSINFIGTCAVVTIISGAILYFNRFEDYQEDIELLKKPLLLDDVKFIYDDLRILIKIIVEGIFSFTVVIGAFLAIIWGLTPDQELGASLPDYQRIVSIGLIMIFVYSLFGLVKWVYSPIYELMKKLRRSYFDSTS